ncbi:NAD(P)H-hydrate dehydratase [Candidatus Roizmanbacteria bacterium RIFCSPHIGHO2_01_FULL_39_12c]|uniref:ADP-dependent (S)-NAD(P)H-hydrate dehydratase n=1 Tax=Candidatus Roizmanbacteria bacterium RIFCSPHIGHO2_01_FULL_39_12c TaxID=1802031 RepID=A0A1F7GEJ9_9BACT|nr:MAG: NAD(P)H-hydrate dehydratase [Candidatus Roizmanbacteria bacterium RIFCSPHIGHO2_01_FULL_39_12c]OGK47986.1 MAG: NAD(P)H-hydrate dehydratase [Candidatus Roizmanbacteria bacterium RIFCSPLOWO2_01_FULL_40_13]
MLIKTSGFNSIKPFIKSLNFPKFDSHKGQNGRVLVIGGSSLFHSASIWAAEVASYFVDMVHYSSTRENNKIFLSWKKKFRNGMVISQKELLDYVGEDDVVLIGPGMMRGKISQKSKVNSQKFEEILKIQNEADYTYYLTKYLLRNFPQKKFVIDAGALQMMDPEWLKKLKTKAIITPHQKEFMQLFGLPISLYSAEEKIRMVQKQAKKYNCVILLKAVNDIISDGIDNCIVNGGNAGLTKGGTGDILAGLTAAFYCKNKSLNSCIISSYLLKKTADTLFAEYGYWYNIDKIIDKIPIVLKRLKDNI